MSLLFAIAMLLFLYGLVAIWKTVPAEGAMDSVSRIGVLMLAFAISCLIVTTGLNHAIVHITQHGIGSEQTEGRLQDISLTLQATKFGLRYIAGSVGVLGFVLLSLGLSTRLPAGFKKVTARVTFVCSALALILLLITEHYHGIDIGTAAQISILPVAVIIIWVVILGVGLYKGDSRLSPDTARERVP